MTLLLTRGVQGIGFHYTMGMHLFSTFLYGQIRRRCDMPKYKVAKLKFKGGNTVLDAEETRRFKAKSLRHKKPIVKDLNVE